MPEVRFSIEWPNGERTRCYSPSTVVREYFAAGAVLSIGELVEKSAEAFDRARERVRAKYGFFCASASGQLREIQSRARRFRPEEKVKIVDVT